MGPAVESTIHVIEDHSRDHLVRTVRALCQVMPPLPQPWSGVSSVPRKPGQEAPVCVFLGFGQPSRAFAGEGRGTRDRLGWRCSWSGPLTPSPTSLFAPEGQGPLPV